MSKNQTTVTNNAPRTYPRISLVGVLGLFLMIACLAYMGEENKRLIKDLAVAKGAVEDFKRENELYEHALLAVVKAANERTGPRRFVYEPNVCVQEINEMRRAISVEGRTATFTISDDEKIQATILSSELNGKPVGLESIKPASSSFTITVVR